jgi:hypothetical protein
MLSYLTATLELLALLTDQVKSLRVPSASDPGNSLYLPKCLEVQSSRKPTYRILHSPGPIPLGAGTPLIRCEGCGVTSQGVVLALLQHSLFCSTRNFCGMVRFAGDGLSSVGRPNTNQERVLDSHHRPPSTGRVKSMTPARAVSPWP